MKRPSKSLNSGSPLPWPSSLWMRSANMRGERPNPKKSEMCQPEGPYTPVVDVVVLAVAAAVADKMADVATDARSTNAHTAKWTIIPPKHAKRDDALKTSTAIQAPPGMTSEHAITAVSQGTSSLTASTSNMPGINATNSTKAQHPHRILQQEMAT